MRQVTFKGKLAHSGEWVYGHLLQVEGNWHIVNSKDFEEDGHHIKQISDEPSWVIESTIGESTGIKDVNGVPIFEGDILSISDECENYKPVVFYDGRFCVKIAIDTYFDIASISANIRIVGNVYNNPMLVTD